MNQLSFGSAPGLGAGDACGRCFAVTANADPYSPGYGGPFKTIVVKVTDLCPVSGNEEFCGQTTSNPKNQHGMSTQYAPPSYFANSYFTDLTLRFVVSISARTPEHPALSSLQVWYSWHCPY